MLTVAHVSHSAGMRRHTVLRALPSRCDGSCFLGPPRARERESGATPVALNCEDLGTVRNEGPGLCTSTGTGKNLEFPHDQLPLDFEPRPSFSTPGAQETTDSERGPSRPAAGSRMFWRFLGPLKHGPKRHQLPAALRARPWQARGCRILSTNGDNGEQQRLPQA